MLKLKGRFALILAGFMVIMTMLSAPTPVALAATTINVTTTTDELTAPGTGCSLREAIQNFNDDAATYPECGAWANDPTTIILPAGTYDLTISLAGLDDANVEGDLDIARAGTLTIQGADKTTTFIGQTLANPERLLDMFVAATVTINDLTFQNGSNAGGSGGAISIRPNGNLTVNNSIFTGNTAGFGGALNSSTNTTLTVNNTTFTGNSATDGGGAIFAIGSTTVNNSIFTGNTVTTLNGGGAIYTAAGSSLTVNDSTFTGNIITAVANATSNSGGAINALSTVTVNNSIFTGNKAIGSGGAIHQAAAATLTVSGSDFMNNVAGSSNFQAVGGAIRTWPGSTANISNSTFTGNTGGSGVPGGAISNQAALTISGSFFTNNVVTNTQSTDGGGAIIHYAGSLTVSSSTFSGNTSRDSGGAISARGGTLDINSSSFSNSSSTVDVGGAIETIIPTAITNTTFYSNTAPGGAAIDFGTAAIRLVNNTFAYNINTAATNGTVANLGSNLTMINNIIAYSTNKDCSGAVNTNTTNFIEDNTCSPAFSGDPKLDTANNSGLGGTLVYPLLAGSPAIDKGTSTGAPTTDQRGTARPSGTGIDIGAYESPFAAIAAAAVGGVAELITPRAGYPVAMTVGMVAMSLMLMGAGAWLMRRA